jgi:LmbE family N-acetylglucosaminyl deacetylase
MAQSKKKTKSPAPLPAQPKPKRARAHKAAARSTPAAKKTSRSAHSRAKAAKPRKTAAHKPAQLLLSTPPQPVLTRLVHSCWFGRIFAIVAVLILLTTTVYWAILSARLQRINADQLIDSYLFENGPTFHGAIFPGAHSFLLKWPIFWLMQPFGYSRDVFITFTVSLVVGTVSALVAVLHQILRQRLVMFGSLCLALASVLLLVPAQPAAGALLPVNMAMTTTRNIEYIYFLASVYAFVRSQRLRDRWFGLGVLLAIILIASDKLFAPLFIGGALIALVVQFGIRRLQPTSDNKRWLIGGVAATVIATIVLKLITALHITTIANGSTASPYPLVHSAKQIVEALVFGVGSLLTNFGANPVHEVVVIKDIPSALIRSVDYSSVAYLVNALVLVGSLWAAYKLWMLQYRHAVTDIATRFALALCYASIVSAIIYGLTDHYYPVDARYITIALFALFVAAAVYLRQYALRLRYVLLAAAVLLAAIGVGLFASQQEYQQSKSALHSRAQLNAYLSDKMKQYNVGTLIGDYWYVALVKARATQPLTIVPMASCKTPRDVLLSQAWLQAPHYKAVAYLAVKDSGQATYGGCTMEQLTQYYGVPERKFVVSGTSSQPDQLLLLYRQGIKHLLHGPRPAVVTLPKPVPTPTLDPGSLSNTNPCLGGATMNIVAHEDDDLLFMSPDLLHQIRDGRCMTTVFLTAGDAGRDAAYSTGRQQGAQSAYSEMYNAPNVWKSHVVTVAGHVMTVEYLDGQPNVTLIFLNLPDGGVQGAGYTSTNTETLSELRLGTKGIIHSTDGTAAYTSSGLDSTLTQLMEIYQPDEIHTLDYNIDQYDGDHSDHHAAGYFAKKAYAGYSRPSVLRAYAGYPGRYNLVNVLGQDAIDKEAAFLHYAQYDTAVCQTMESCHESATYGNYLVHQYSKLVNAHVQPE